MARKKSTAKAVAKDPSVKIRMYNVGFGDCFLLRLPGADGNERKLLIDCGKHRLSVRPPRLKQIVEQVIKDLEEGEKDGPRVNVLVATHRHWDHVSGFAYQEWSRVTVGEVWMPWTEDPDDDDARAICEAQSSRARNLRKFTRRLKLGAVSRRYDYSYLLRFAGNNLNNRKAMAMLHNGFKGRPGRQFLPKRETTLPPESPPRSPSIADGLVHTEHLPGIQAYVLGPSRKPDVIRDMIPPAGEFYEFALGDPAAAGDDDAPAGPFAEHWRLTASEYASWYDQWHEDNDLDEDNPLEAFVHKRPRKRKETGWEDWAKYIGHAGDEPELELAASLESAVNGTSLVLLLKVGSATLLFPGDAQWGTWSAILEDDRWRHLLKNVSVYKVGHHGSENATPRRFVEDYLPRRALAMIPTDRVEKWPMIPKGSLLEALKQRDVSIARSDLAEGPDPAPFERHAQDGYTLYVDAEIRC